MAGSQCTLSVVVPVYFGSATITDLVDKLLSEIPTYIRDFEIILVNDGSTDSSSRICGELASRHAKHVCFIDLAKNFSEHNAVMAGLNFVRGDYAVIIDDDFQNPPEEIYKMYQKILGSGADVVYSRYEKKQHHWMRNLGSRFNDVMATYMLSKPKHLYLSSFKIMARSLVNEVIKYRGPYPYIDGLILRSTQYIETEPVRHVARENGRSNYTIRKLVSLWSNMFINFSIEPLRWALKLGFLFAFTGFVAAGYFLMERITHPSLPLGWASLIVSSLVLSGVQLVVVGMLGEFVGRLYLGSTGKPQYVVRSVSKRDETHE